MRYFKIQVELGHLGFNKGLPTYVYVKSKSIVTAMNVARKLPCVKHHKLVPYAVEITKEEYIEGSKNNKYLENIEKIFDDEIKP